MTALSTSTVVVISRINQQLGPRSAFRQREVSMVNASFGLTRGNWDLRVWGRNLTNDQWLITGSHRWRKQEVLPAIPISQEPTEPH